MIEVHHWEEKVNEWERQKGVFRHEYCSFYQSGCWFHWWVHFVKIHWTIHLLLLYINKTIYLDGVKREAKIQAYASSKWDPEGTCGFWLLSCSCSEGWLLSLPLVLWDTFLIISLSSTPPSSFYLVISYPNKPWKYFLNLELFEGGKKVNMFCWMHRITIEYIFLILPN